MFIYPISLLKYYSFLDIFDQYQKGIMIFYMIKTGDKKTVLKVSKVWGES